MPIVELKDSPLLPGRSPVPVYYRDSGKGETVLLHLHGGWGYAAYPFDRQIDAFESEYRILIPDRTGYGRSLRIEKQPFDFHRCAAVEMLRFLDRLRIQHAVLWGHSDGAVIAALMALAAPDSVHAIILEAFHLYRDKPGSREFFETMANDPDGLGDRVTVALAQDHGEDYWRPLIRMNGQAWLDLAAAAGEKEDFYDGRLSELAVPTLFLHGKSDPRTEPDELEKIRKMAPRARVEILEEGRHSPHSESSSFEEANRLAREFLRSL